MIRKEDWPQERRREADDSLNRIRKALEKRLEDARRPFLEEAAKITLSTVALPEELEALALAEANYKSARCSVDIHWLANEEGLCEHCGVRYKESRDG